jgi:hypothetical protein
MALSVSNLTGFGGVAQPPTITHTDTANSNVSDDELYTFSSVSLGVEAPDRIVAIAAFGYDATSNTSFDGATINGVTASIALEIPTNGSPYDTTYSLFYANVPTGTSVTVDVSAITGAGPSTTMDNCTIFVWAIYGSSGGPYLATTAENNSGTTISPSLTLTATSVVIGGSQLEAIATATWSSLTEDSDVTVEGVRRTAASGANLIGTLTETITYTASGDKRAFLAAWR